MTATYEFVMQAKDVADAKARAIEVMRNLASPQYVPAA